MTNKGHYKSNLAAIKAMSEGLENLHHHIYPLSYRGIDKKHTIKTQKDIRTCFNSLATFSKVLVKGINSLNKDGTYNLNTLHHQPELPFLYAGTGDKPSKDTVYIAHHRNRHALCERIGIGFTDGSSFMDESRHYWFEQYNMDVHLNKVPLITFDAYFPHHKRIADQLKIPWAMSDTVSCLKHTILHELLGVIKEKL
ncbi:unnamed protein product [marine sediment metagenome]|uniref:Uncharacterized protein n=1 Tax=marine sediment metagenome TaxID=412755 RepID=X0XV70_9ZZZZ